MKWWRIATGLGLSLMLAGCLSEGKQEGSRAMNEKTVRAAMAPPRERWVEWRIPPAAAGAIRDRFDDDMLRYLAAYGVALDSDAVAVAEDGATVRILAEPATQRRIQEILGHLPAAE